MKYRAYAKVNLNLKVINKRIDGYHNLYTVMDLVDVYDEIDINKNDDIIFTCSDKELENDNNLILKAINILKKVYPICQNSGVSIHLEKHIPYGAGLGGGSSDAACVISALNDIWGLKLSLSDLIKVAIQVGSDVPFFLLRSRGVLKGIGEEINKIDSKLLLYYVIISPNYPMSTKLVYENNKVYSNDITSALRMIDGFKKENALDVINNMENDLTQSAINLNNCEPTIKNIIDASTHFINDNKLAGNAIMSGSGSCVVCCFSTRNDANLFYDYMVKTRLSCIFCASILL